MDLLLTEKQLKLILSKEVTEQVPGTPDAAANAKPDTGISKISGGGQGYPGVEKWESGVTRGPGNQIGVTKWSDVVGSSIKRGKGNPLN
jgi:hypothetical protein